MSSIYIQPDFTTEGGATLHDVPIAYRTWGHLNAAGTNAVLVGHALTGDADLSAWWQDLIGPGQALDPEQDFVICANVPGSPYGSVSPVTTNPSTGAPYGADFPAFTIRDTVALHRHLLDALGVRRVRCAIGGSMGGMQVLEWAFERTPTGAPLVERLVPIAVGGRHTPWQIGWSEAQRQAIYADSKWQSGAYPSEDPPTDGLAAARTMAMVSYRSHTSFQRRFGRQRQSENGMPKNGTADAPFAVQSYLRYHGQKLVDRFDARCYVQLTQQMDTHDVSRNRGAYPDVLQQIEQPALVVGIDSDVLYPLAEQDELAGHLPNADLQVLASPHGHDAFLIEQEALNALIVQWKNAHVASATAR
jgi:homoserine O-acetyltransferase